jgi:hypothetical protein
LESKRIDIHYTNTAAFCSIYHECFAATGSGEWQVSSIAAHGG